MTGYIYRITNLTTQQHYIGQTIDIKRRRRQHFNDLQNNNHDNPKLQASWNKYGEKSFEFESWEFQIKNRIELNALECEYIEKYNALSEGFNLAPGGGHPPINQKVNNDDIITFLCVFEILGDGYGKTFEQIFGWAKGTASAIKRQTRYPQARLEYERMSPELRKSRGEDFIESQKLKELALQRQLTQGGCKKAYSLTEEDYNFAFAAQDKGYSYALVAQHLGVKPTTVKDWFNGRSRRKERKKYDTLSSTQKMDYYNKVESVNLLLNGRDRISEKKEEDIISFLCYDKIYPKSDTKIQHFFGWPDGTCHHMRKPNLYIYTKAKMSLLTQEQIKEIADNLHHQL